MQANNLKTTSVHTRINPLEKELFHKIAKANGVTASRLNQKLIRELINNEVDLIPEEIEVFKSAIRQLAGISRNLNQLTRAVNSGKIPAQINNEKYWIDIKTHVTQVRTELEKYIDISALRWVKR